MRSGHWPRLWDVMKLTPVERMVDTVQHAIPDPRILELIQDQHGQHMVGFAMRLSLDPDRAGDAVQETMSASGASCVGPPSSRIRSRGRSAPSTGSAWTSTCWPVASRVSVAICAVPPASRALTVIDASKTVVIRAGDSTTGACVTADPNVILVVPSSGSAPPH